LFPKALDPEAAREILAGGQAKVNEAGALVVGGHTVRNEELLYGLSVTGIVDGGRVLRNVGAKPGDALVLTKPLGTGLLINGGRRGLARAEDLAAALGAMATLNRAASEEALAHGAHAATDITGFGLVGHALKMARGSGVSFWLDVAALPLYAGAAALARAGVTTGSTKPNRAIGAGQVRAAGRSEDEALPLVLDQVIHDPQTSGGLLLAVPAAQADALVRALHARGVYRAVRVGMVEPAGAAAIVLRGALDLAD
jgi:selenide,water dikinase